MPDVRGTYEDYPVGMVKYWQARESLKSVQVVVLRDPAGEQEARFRFASWGIPDIVALSWRRITFRS